jgi:hypothetical protein
MNYVGVNFDELLLGGIEEYSDTWLFWMCVEVVWDN